MTIVADQYNYVVGIDTHARQHAYAIVGGVSGTVIGQRSFPTTTAGLARAADWIQRHTQSPGVDPACPAGPAGPAGRGATLISAEGTGSYGARAAALFTDRGWRVVEAPTPPKTRIRGKGKTDPADALAAARSTMGMDQEQLRDRRVDGVRTALQCLVTRRDQLARQRTAEVNRLTALLRANDLGIDARGGVPKTQIRQIADWRTRSEAADIAIIREIAVDHARTIRSLDQRLADNEAKLTQVVKDHAPDLLDHYGVGPVNAAILLTVWSHHGRIRTSAAWANIAGVAPIPVHSGNTRHYRLSRGGDRRLNRAIHSIMLTRCRSDETKAFIAERVSQGKTEAKARRQLKHYIARQLYRSMNRTHPLQPEPRPATTAA